jgi:hypothetical protein
MMRLHRIESLQPEFLPPNATLFVISIVDAMWETEGRGASFRKFCSLFLDPTLSDASRQFLDQFRPPAGCGSMQGSCTHVRLGLDVGSRVENDMSHFRRPLLDHGSEDAFGIVRIELRRFVRSLERDSFGLVRCPINHLGTGLEKRADSGDAIGGQSREKLPSIDDLVSDENGKPKAREYRCEENPANDNSECQNSIAGRPHGRITSFKNLGTSPRLLTAIASCHFTDDGWDARGAKHDLIGSAAGLGNASSVDLDRHRRRNQIDR